MVLKIFKKTHHNILGQNQCKIDYGNMNYLHIYEINRFFVLFGSELVV